LQAASAQPKPNVAEDGFPGDWTKPARIERLCAVISEDHVLVRSKPEADADGLRHNLALTYRQRRVVCALPIDPHRITVECDLVTRHGHESFHDRYLSLLGRLNEDDVSSLWTPESGDKYPVAREKRWLHARSINR
jgi:hypothetical protein